MNKNPVNAEWITSSDMLLLPINSLLIQLFTEKGSDQGA
jgi:hypothetical protein